MLVEDAKTQRARFASVEFGGGARRGFGAASLELGESDGELGAVTNAFFNNGENGDAGKTREQMFEPDDAGFEFAVADGFGEFFQFESLINGKFADGGAGNFGEMCAAAELFAHLVGERADIGARRTFDDEAGDRSVDFGEAVFKYFDFDGS